jgi:hypothetical protein
MASYTRNQQLTIRNWLICSLLFSLSWLNGETEAKLQPLRYVFSRGRRVSHCADLQCVASFASESFRDVCICFYSSSIHTKYHVGAACSTQESMGSDTRCIFGAHCLHVSCSGWWTTIGLENLTTYCGYSWRLSFHGFCHELIFLSTSVRDAHYLHQS